MDSDQAYSSISNPNPPFSHKAFPEDFLASCPCTYWYFSFPKCFGISCISQFMYYFHHLLLLYLNITADGNYSHEIKRLLLFGRKVMTNLDSALKSRDIILLTKVCKVIVFPVVRYGCESWTIKKAEHRRIDAFELWFWRRLLKVPWTARRPNQTILKEISPEYSLEGLMLKLQYFGHLLRRANSLEKTPMMGKIEGQRGRGWQSMRWLESITKLIDINLRKFWEIVEDREAWSCKELNITK